MSASESSLGAVRCSRRPPFRHLGFTVLRSCMNDKYFHPVRSPTNSIHIHNHLAQQLSNSAKGVQNLSTLAARAPASQALGSKGTPPLCYQCSGNRSSESVPLPSLSAST